MSGSTVLAIPLLGRNSAPGNYLFEEDDTAFAAPPSTTIGGIVIGCQQGPIMSRITGGPSSFIQQYGKPNPNWSLAAYSALTFLKASQNLIVRRAVNIDASTAASYLFFESGSVVQAVDGLNCIYTPYQDLNYAGAVPNFETISTLPNFSTLNANTACTITYQINGGVSTSASTTIGANASALVANINAALASVGITVALGFISVTNSFTYDQPALYFIGPSTDEFSLTSVSYASTVMQPLTGIFNDVLAVIAQNPGAWPNQNFGWTITNVDLGSPQQITLTFNRKLVAGDTITFQGNVYNPTLTVNANSYNTSATAAYATSNDNTLQLLANALSQFWYMDASVVVPDTTGNNAREIIISFQGLNTFGNYYAIQSTMVNPNNGPCDYTTANVATTYTSGGALSAVVQQTVVGQASSGTFNFNVYSSSNPNVPLETFSGGLNNTTNALGANTSIEAIVNADGSGSKYVRLVSTLPIPNTIFPQQLGNITTINWLGGGADGSLPTNVQIAEAWNDFADVDNIDVDMLINGGYASPIVAQAMDQVAQTRQDLAFSYIDAPSSVQGTSAAFISYRQNQLNISSNRSALFGPDVYIQDPYSGQQLYVPMSGFEAALQALADTAIGPNQAAAGPTYGILNGVLGLRYIYGKTDRGLLNGAQINIAKKLRAGGFAVYGAVTLQTTTSLLSYIPVRRIFSYVEELILDLLEGVDFSNITPTLELNVQQNVNGYLRLFIAQNAIANGKCITDSTVNTQQYTNNGQFNVRVIIFPFVPDQFVVLDAVLTNDSTVFTESVVSA